MSTQLYLPQGRMVGGDLYTPQTTNMQGGPLTDTKGNPRTDYVCMYAIAKNPGVDWRQEPWGQAMVAVGVAGFPGGQHQMPTFAWKVVDGDSTVLNQNMKRPCDNPNYRGHWIVRIKGGFPSPLAQINPATGRPERFDVKDAIVPGDYIQACVSFAANANLQKPGIYVNPVAYCLMSKGERIVNGPDVTQMAFGGAAAPAAPPPAYAPPPAPVAAPASPAPAPVPPPPLPVTPNPALLASPAVFPPADWVAHPSAPGYFYKGQEVLTEADLRARGG